MGLIKQNIHDKSPTLRAGGCAGTRAFANRCKYPLLAIRTTTKTWTCIVLKMLAGVVKKKKKKEKCFP